MLCTQLHAPIHCSNEAVLKPKFLHSEVQVKTEAVQVKTEADAEDATATTEGATKEDGKKETPKTRFDDLNPQMLKCHICNKSMWDGRSFENHISGRAHSIMMQKTAESYALTADTMRQEFKVGCPLLYSKLYQRRHFAA